MDPTHMHIPHTLHTHSHALHLPPSPSFPHTHNTHTHIGLYSLPGSRLASQRYNMEALISCKEEVPEEEGEAELDHFLTGMV